MQALEVAALALPVADRVVHEIQLREPAEILNRKHRREYRLQAAVLALGREQIHLQKPLIGVLLNLDQVRNLDRAADFGKIQPLALPHRMIPISIGHAFTSLKRRVEPKRQKAKPKTASPWVPAGPIPC